MRLTVLAVLAIAAATPAFCAPAVPGLGADANAKFLSDNGKKAGVVSVPGIQYQVLKKGNGAQPGRHDCVTVYYSGSLIDGKIFDKTEPGKPATFPAGLLIPGWVEALQMMHAGDKWHLVIPSGLAYGRDGAGNGLIPPDQTLVFDVELLKVSPPVNGSCG